MNGRGRAPSHRGIMAMGPPQPRYSASVWPRGTLGPRPWQMPRAGSQSLLGVDGWAVFIRHLIACFAAEPRRSDYIEDAAAQPSG